MDRPKPRPPLGRTRRPRTVQETSAGGVVIDPGDDRPRAAIIGRLSRRGNLEWCLPKGHLEAGESAEQAAVREVAEETGIQSRIIAPLGSIDYWFAVGGRRVHKVVHHYLLEATGGHLTVEGDPDGEAVEAAWVPLDELGARLAFANERRLVEEALALLADRA